MYLDELSNRVTQDLDNAISAELPVGERAAILKIVQQALLDASGRTHKEYREAVIACCGPEAATFMFHDTSALDRPASSRRAARSMWLIDGVAPAARCGADM